LLLPFCLARDILQCLHMGLFFCLVIIVYLVKKVLFGA
jgi:hypothetical protein